MEFQYKIKGITLDVYDMIKIKQYYEQRCTAEYIMEKWNIGEEVALRLAVDVRKIMDKLGCDEDFAIKEAFERNGLDYWGAFKECDDEE